MARRCDCHGDCGHGARRRVCADPDLTGRCRGEDLVPHPRRLLDAEVRLDPDDQRHAYCWDCWTARTSHPPAPGPLDTYELFPLDEVLSKYDRS